ncbi:MAG: YbhB/YbcL family Raf kinase inhibitor-like protein [Deltaproteobacteria bacterium]|nr:MAG: YbhB/YbcL family Raf kinase inhibitor-like protein [Deltaproteobacteria bacterium]
MAFSLTSPAFTANGAISKEYSCDGANRSPELGYLPGDVTGLPAGVPADETVRGGTHGTNSFRKLGYGGPCPPPGKVHHYVFKLYALSAPTALKPRATKDDVLHAIEGHVVGQAELIGTYAR